MQLASSGARATARNAHNFIHQQNSRNIHIPAYARIPPSAASNSSGAAQRIVTRTRHLFGQFVAHLTAPGLKEVQHSAPSYARAVHNGAPGRIPSIQQRFSLPVRTSLSRPLQGHYFPRPPPVGRPCSVTNMGLGTVRNFSSGRSVFSNLVENVPIAGRAFYEADWDVKREKQAVMKKGMKAQQKTVRRGKEMLKPRSQNVARVSKEEQLKQFFSTPEVAPVTTCLLIPLAPTPTARVPLPEYTPETQSLLPHAELWNMHTDHEQHSLKVSSLFSRLDVANVWERGVECSAYAHSTGPDGACTILKVEFVGWTKSQVRGVIGESGTGWCVLEETATQPEPEDDALSDTSSILSGLSGEISDSMESLGPSLSDHHSFVLPVLDFSSSFRSSVSGSTTPASDYDMVSDSYSDSWSDLSGSHESLTSLSGARLGFSSDFLKRSGVDVEDGPKELMF